MNRTIINIIMVLTFSAGFVNAQDFDRIPDPSPNQVLPELKEQAYVGTQQFAPQRDEEWVTRCLNLCLDRKKLGCRIVAYRIQWFNGRWSGWFVPGVNDLYKKSFEPLRRQWACFNDHGFEIIYEADRKMEFHEYRPINP